MSPNLGLLVFGVWMVTSFLSHQSSKIFLTTAVSATSLDNGFIWAVIVTTMQTVMCFLLVDLHLSEQLSTRAQTIFVVKVTCHILATLSTNYSMSLVEASSTFAIKLLEPITSAIVQYFALGVSLSLYALFSLPFAIGGALVFCGSSVFTSMSKVGVAVAFLSNVILAFRNVAIKVEHDDSSLKTVQLRGRYTVTSVMMSLICLVIVVVYLMFQKSLATPVGFMILSVTSSSLFHVIYSYISTNVVLSYMTVLSHSYAKFLKRILVVLLLYAVGQREASPTSFIGLAVCIGGLALYLKGQAQSTKNIQLSSVGESLTSSENRTPFIGIFLFIIIFSTSFTCFLLQKDRTIRIETDHSPIITSADPFIDKSYHGTEFTKYIQVTNFSCNCNMTKQQSEFRSKRLIDTPLDTDVLSPHLTSSVDVIKEAQRIHFNIFADLLAGYKYAILLDVAVSENKGDSAITAGEIYLLRRFGIKVLGYCIGCSSAEFDKFQRLAENHSPKELVILLHGGGNMVGYFEYGHDGIRYKSIKMFSAYKVIMFPQSIFMREGSETKLKHCQDYYKDAPNFIMMLRDRLSLKYGLEYFNGPSSHLMLVPDMAFQIGAVKRFSSPMYDILWLRRTDGESPHYQTPSFPPDISVHVADWLQWRTPPGKTPIESAFLMTNTGFMFLQRGRVVVTDRLHGHILSTLSDIPHVLLDNRYKKLSAYHNTWTRGVKNTLMTDNAEEALVLALQLLKKYNETLPPIAPIT